MKNSFMRNVFALVMALIMVFSLVACGDSQGNNGGYSGQSSSPNGDSSGNTDNWGVKINGKTVTLPCTLTELSKAGVVLDDFDLEIILNSENETHYMIPATCGDESKHLFLEIVTGPDASKKEKNATVYTITNNNRVDGSVFVVKNGLALGSSVTDIISAYGNDYVIDAATSRDDLAKEAAMIHYGDDQNGILLWFEDGVLIYVELYANTNESE